MPFRKLILCALLLCANALIAQENAEKRWGILSGHEVNYTGNNAVLHALYEVNRRHTIEAGLNYNFSDGFAANPVIGLGVSYGYTIAARDKWNAAVGIDYRRQKPLSIVNIQTITYATKAKYNITDKWSAYSRVGYGVALERARSSGNFTQSNNISGSFSLGCVFHL